MDVRKKIIGKTELIRWMFSAPKDSIFIMSNYMIYKNNFFKFKFIKWR